MNQIWNAFSVDLEEYFHAENIRHYFTKKPESRAVFNTNLLLDLLEEQQITATFFVLNSVAEEHPSLIKKISSAGHEIASHGHAHQLVYRQTPTEFREDIYRAKTNLENLTGQAVLGYRAPSFSITEKARWAFSIIAEVGYRYDSSVYPIWHPRYANTNQARFPFLHEKIDLVEVPLSTTQFSFHRKKINLPIAGGGYWRLLPLSYTHYGIKTVHNKEHQSIYTYIHPWEIDPEQIRLKNIPYLTRWRHYGGQADFAEKLRNIFTAYRFTNYLKLLQSHFPHLMSVAS